MSTGLALFLIAIFMIVTPIVIICKEVRDEPFEYWFTQQPFDRVMRFHLCLLGGLILLPVAVSLLFTTV